ncbi:CubicO group peptidase (beta-lactamase class C family) [Flavobacterium nitrogenifigens]|uniref:CubicO group peptidase (Beta-lactamase class C family) n=2 Tax=Flavobacterium TaxID=237 RepID=A0A7W7IWQ4_9FLAO|nr:MULTISPECIES: serine hydrolase [Flavobacterium]MBB4801315.1 CubicO group peptidase (beta-lactamase class C family) [Flavobacterium nitrogenifigens]MBB6384937.1 CubicO group peptidase (beta-lactamase class C family) [Flavobacterium notoginsengisoli]
MKIINYIFQLKIFFAGILFFQIQNAISQEEKSSELYKIIMSRDSLLFNVGFNTCDISVSESLCSDQLEFYHDKNGLSNKADFVKTMKSGLCASPSTYQSRRELIDESNKIYPLYKNGVLYAALQTGIHYFHENKTNKGEPFLKENEKLVGKARFSHLWVLENNVWKLKRILSYDHEPTNSIEEKSALFDNDLETEKWLKENNVPALGLGIISEGKLKQIKTFGKLKRDVPAPYNTIWNVASLTKPVTAIVTLKLVSQGKWNLDEPLYKYWTDPDIAKDSNLKLLTTRIVLSHQTGFPNWRSFNESGKLDFKFKPGTKYQYSGEGFEYLRKALEKKFGKTLDQLASELIFKPLQMNDSQLIWNDKIDLSRYAVNYDKDGNAYEPTKNKTASAADDLLTTVGDYGKFLCSVMNSEGLSQNVFNDMISHQVETKKNKYFGLGFEIYDLGNDNYALSHGGADKGVQTLFFLLPKTRQGLIIFTNVDDGYKVYAKLIEHFLGEDGKKLIDIETKS